MLLSSTGMRAPHTEIQLDRHFHVAPERHRQDGWSRDQLPSHRAGRRRQQRVAYQPPCHAGNGRPGQGMYFPHSSTIKPHDHFQEGLDIVRASPEVMRCYGSPFDAKYHSESGASRAILEAGKNLDSLMLRYGRIDWANKANWQCNGGYVESMYTPVSQHLFFLPQSAPVCGSVCGWHQPQSTGAGVCGSQRRLCTKQFPLGDLCTQVCRVAAPPGRRRQRMARQALGAQGPSAGGDPRPGAWLL